MVTYDCFPILWTTYKKSCNKTKFDEKMVVFVLNPNFVISL